MVEIADKIRSWLETLFLSEPWREHFLVDIVISGTKIRVVVDSTSGVTIGECQQISRYLEGYLDADVEMPERYVLEVSSPGLDRPLKIPKQYIKNIGRELDIALKEGEAYRGMLKQADDSAIVLVVKKKKQPEQELRIPYTKIKTAKLVLKF